MTIKINPKYLKVYYNKGLTLFELKKFNEAIEAYDMAIKINPNFPEVYYNKG